MFKYLNNNRGVALLTVMSIMTVLVVVASLMLSMSSSESRIIYEYGNNNRAFYIAEAGADLAIKEWKNYINSLPVVYDADGNPVLAVDASINDFLNRLDNKIGLSPTDSGRNLSGNPRYELEKNIRYKYGFNDDDPMAWISYVSNPNSGTLNPVEVLSLTVTGNYDDVTFEQKVKLYYDSNKNIDSYKGSGEITINKVSVTSVTVSPASLFLIAGGETGTLTATVSPATASNKKVTWSSSNIDVATVDSGVVTPVAAGSATITATTADGGYTASCLVTVTPTGPDDPGVPWVDNNGNDKYEPGIDELYTINDIKGRFFTFGKLIVPPSVGSVDAGNNDIAYTAYKGIYIAANLKNKSAQNSITLTSVEGDIKLANGVTLNPFKALTITVLKGNIIADGATLISGSGNSVTLTAANGGVSLAGTSIQAARDVTVSATQDFDGHNAAIATGSNGTVWLGAQGSININNIEITSQKGITVTSGFQKDIYSDNATINAGNNADILLKAGGNISIQAASLNAPRGDLTFYAGSMSNTIYVSSAHLSDGNNVALAAPYGVKIDGSPASGKISYSGY